MCLYTLLPLRFQDYIFKRKASVHILRVTLIATKLNQLLTVATSNIESTMTTFIITTRPISINSIQTCAKYTNEGDLYERLFAKGPNSKNMLTL